MSNVIPLFGRRGTITDLRAEVAAAVGDAPVGPCGCNADLDIIRSLAAAEAGQYVAQRLAFALERLTAQPHNAAARSDARIVLQVAHEYDAMLKDAS